MATPFGLPVGTSSIRKALNDLIKEHNLPPVMFHSLRHTSVTYKLKLNGGDIKAVQADSGHSQINMVTDVYSHIIDDDRRKNAEFFEEAFYEKKDLDPSMHAHAGGKTVELPTDVDAELLAKLATISDCIFEDKRWTEPKKYGKISIRNEALKSRADGG